MGHDYLIASEEVDSVKKVIISNLLLMLLSATLLISLLGLISYSLI